MTMMQHYRTTSFRRRLGFTLTELLVVIGIIVALAAIGLPVALRSYRQVNKTRTQADLQAITVALNAYKQDFGDYPRVGADTKAATGIVSGAGWNIGGAILCKALIGPYGDGVDNNMVDPQDPPASGSLTAIRVGQCVAAGGNFFIALVNDPSSAPAAGSTEWAAFDPRDGADGPGIRIRRGPGDDRVLFTGDDRFQGKVWGPYLQADKFNVSGCMMRDREGNPILYFPASPSKGNIRATTGLPGYVDLSSTALYDARDGIVFFWREADPDNANARKAIQVMLGDFTHNDNSLTGNGRIDPGERPATEAPFLLWTAGPDGLFGPIRPDGGAWTPQKRDIDRCDDITNFQG